MEIEVKAKKGDKEAAVGYDFGDDLNDMTAKFGDEVVFTNARANMKIVLQAGLRRCLEDGKDYNDYANRWIPGVQTTTGITDPVAAMKAKFANMTDEERMAFLDDLKSIG